MIGVKNLTKVFDDGAVRAVDNISFDVPPGTLLTLLGPSGCGKSTTLRAIAGLEPPTSGQIQIGERIVYSSQQRLNLPANRRRIGMVFQSYAIWPHMTVFENVAYPLKADLPFRTNKADVQDRVFRALDLVGLKELAYRRAPNLSGGQQQRVALARALVREPEVLLLDEPLSNLDAKLREVMRKEVRDLQQRLNITTVYVTHDQAEALSISDVVAVMSNGRILEFGDPLTVYETPRSVFAAGFIGTANVVPVEGAASSNGTFSEGKTPMGPIRFSVKDEERRERATKRAVSVLIRPEDIKLSRAFPDDECNTWKARVTVAQFLGSHYDCTLDASGVQLHVEAERHLRMEVGEDIYVHAEPEACIPLLDDESAAESFEQDTARVLDEAETASS